MSLEPIQHDYGGFDSRFLGITLRYESLSALKTYLDVCWADCDPERFKRLASQCLQASKERAFDLYTQGTLLTHELRHFHDSLLSPYGSYLFRLRARAAFNGLQGFHQCRRNRSILPVPIPLWRRKTAIELDQLGGQWRGLLDVDRVDLSLSLDPVQTKLIDTVELQYRLIRGLVTSQQEITEVQPYQIFEASALLAQTQDVCNVFGPQSAALFLRRILSGDVPKSYALPLQLLFNLYAAHEIMQVSFDEVSRIIAWCLFGDYDNDFKKACPAMRFSILYNFLSREGLPSKKCSVQDQFGHWSKRLGCSPIISGIRNTLKYNERFIREFRRMSPGHREAFRALSRAVELRHAACKHMFKQWLREPDRYVHPDEYCRNTHLWVAAPLRAEFAASVLQDWDAQMKVNADRESIPSDDRAMHAWIRLLLQGEAPSVGVEMIDPKVARHASMDMIMTDFLFADFHRDDPSFEMVRDLLETEGLIPMEILA